ncbi:MAG: response regulator transcription factor [Oscillospiraceae bacterium]|nr:response regulator transcription factor [Oscillospiraceae bacterium]MBQ2634564.1 response regulator transcription factor [Oscillospiraceae bacterium]MBR3084014.1 response regulator transcription factor [Oscillospiraceae bacterium]MBR3860770.1 response regulator transcription factor [Oscillospiraceae bacterium]MBR6097052.1 response regulator transcription factor [Oscillospiraceae bacterium]
MKLLVVDDEKVLVKGLKFNLEQEGYTVDVCYDGATAVEMARMGQYDLILMDLMMPGKDGLTASKEIREVSNIPIIMLTARDEERDKLLGFEYGADDYITKPYNILELKARVRALLRRASITPPPEEEPARKLTMGGITLDFDRRSAFLDGREVNLTVKEFELISLLMRNEGKVFSRENLLDIIWGHDYYGEERTVDVHVRRLREKIERNPAHPEHLVTKWGVGYFFRK